MSNCIGPIDINPINNQVVLVDINRTITIVDNNCCTNTVNVTQPVTSVVEVVIQGAQGPQGPSGSQGPVGPQGPAVDTGSLVTTSSFNAFTSSYYLDSASFDSRINNITFDTSSLATTGSNIFIGNQIITGSVGITGSLTVNDINVGQNSINFIDNTNSILTTLSVDNNGNLLLSTGSIILPQGASLTGSVFGTASWAQNASQAITASYALAANIDTSIFVLTSSFNNFTSSYNTGSFTGSFIGSLQGTSSWANNSTTSSYALTASYVQNAQTASYVQNAVSSSFSSTASYVNTLNQDVLITGSLTVLQGATIYGSSSFLYVTASQLAVSASYISVNIFEPSQRFGGLIVYDSGSSQATASLTWDSLNNHWVYQNASGSAYSGGGLISGPKNTGSLGQETYPTLNKIVRGQGGDHIYDSNITDNDTKVSIGISTDITGSLIVTNGITASLQGTASWASQALTASYGNITGSLFGTASWAINALTASYIDGGFY